MSEIYEDAERIINSINQDCEDIIDEVAIWKADGRTYAQLEDLKNFIKTSHAYMGTYLEDLEISVHKLEPKD
jgi:hypothetical protein